jgi:restriction system protein
VARIDLPAADFEVTKAGRTTLVSCKRWKAASHGIVPLQELVALRKARGASEAVYLCGGALSDNARQYAADFGVRLVMGADLAHLLRDIGLRPKA